MISESVTKLIDEFAKLPGIGKKSAERLAYHVLRATENEALGLADAIRDVKQNVHYCSACYNLAEEDLCSICRDTRRDPSVLCVVEQTRDLMALEQSGTYHGLFHVLLGRIAPLEGMGPDDLTDARPGGLRALRQQRQPARQAGGFQQAGQASPAGEVEPMPAGGVVQANRRKVFVRQPNRTMARMKLPPALARSGQREPVAVVEHDVHRGRRDLIGARRTDAKSQMPNLRQRHVRHFFVGPSEFRRSGDRTAGDQLSVGRHDADDAGLAIGDEPDDLVARK